MYTPRIPELKRNSNTLTSSATEDANEDRSPSGGGGIHAQFHASEIVSTESGAANSF